MILEIVYFKLRGSFDLWEKDIVGICTSDSWDAMLRKKGVHLQFEINTCIFVCLFCRKGVPLLYFVISALHFDFSADSCVAWFSKRVHFEDQWKLNSRKSWRLLGHYVISGPIVICIRYIVHCVLCFQFRILKKFKVTEPRTVSVTSSTWRSF